MRNSKKDTCCVQVRQTQEGLSEKVTENPRCPHPENWVQEIIRGQNHLTIDKTKPTVSQEDTSNRPILVFLKGFPPFYYNSIDDCLEDYPYYLEALCIEDPGDQEVEFGYYDESDETSRSVKENSHLIFIKFRTTAYGLKDPLVEGVCSSFKELIELREKSGLGMFLHYNCIDSAPFKRSELKSIKRNVNKLISK